MNLRTILLAQADAYCAAHGITRARLGLMVMNDNKFFDQIENGGRGFTTTTFDKFQTFFSQEKASSAA